MTAALRKYPRTPHLTGSRLQPGDDDVAQVPPRDLAGRHVVAEEKLDGSNVGIWFDESGTLRLQSRGHVLSGGPRERQFDRFKAWAAQYRDALWARLGSRYICYGEWLWATHTIFYDALPHHFVEFDVFDRHTETFLDTPARAALLDGGPTVAAPVLRAGVCDDPAALPALVGPSRFVTADAPRHFADALAAASLDPARNPRRADLSGLAEGLYLKVEEGGAVVARYKWIRASFHDSVAAAGEHWADLPMIANRLAP